MHPALRRMRRNAMTIGRKCIIELGVYEIGMCTVSNAMDTWGKCNEQFLEFRETSD